MLNIIISSSTHFPAIAIISFFIMSVQRVLTAELPKVTRNKKTVTSSDHTVGNKKLLDGIAKNKMASVKLQKEIGLELPGQKGV